MIDRWIDDGNLRAAFAATFSLDPSSIYVTEDTQTLIGQRLVMPRILLEHVRREGPFPLQLDIFLGGDELERQVPDLISTLERARDLARRLDAVMLFGTGPIGYEEQIRVAPDGTVDIVQLDGDELDEDRFVIIGARPISELPTEAAHAPA